MKPALGRAFSFWMVGALALLALMAPTLADAQEPETALVDVATYGCTGLAAPGLLTEVGSDCTDIGGSYDFYLYGDGTDDNWSTTDIVGESNAIALIPGDYQVHENPYGVLFDLTVPAEGTSIAFGIPVAGETPAPPTEPEPPVAETATLSVSTDACTSVLGAPIALVDICPDCVLVSTDLQFYLRGDGTDEHATLTSSADGTVAVELPVGGYEVWDVTTWQKVGLDVPAEGGKVAIGIPAFEFGVTP